MERESFEDYEVAELLNKNFISIKVDREERPDIDHIYMTVCQAITGHGGWPLTIFMSPDHKPFYAGTYYPKTDRMGMPGFMTLLGRIHKAWTQNRESILESGEQIVNILESQTGVSTGEVNMELLHQAYQELDSEFDNTYGGFGNAPKFPTPHNLYFLLRYWFMTKKTRALEMVEKTLDSMYMGGIYDHIGFGFSRYSTDRKWLVPHFEKMLYDNALLSIAYIEAWQATRKTEYAEAARQILTYILRDMTSPDGAFYSAEDADSEGMEGKFYIWTPKEIEAVLGPGDAARFNRLYDITEKGNFEGENIPNLIDSSLKDEDRQFVNQSRQKLFEHREKRVHPYKDDKILTAWNGLMIAAMSLAGRALGNQEYTTAAGKAARFILDKLVREDGRLLARFRDGQAAYPAYVDDYSFLIWGLLELYETTYKPDYLSQALKLNDDLLKLFRDEAEGGLYLYGSDSEQLISRPKEVYDGATPSGNSVATLNFLRLARLTGRTDLEKLAYDQFKAFGGFLERMPRAYSFMLSALSFALSGSREVVLIEGKNKGEAFNMLGVLRKNFHPFSVSILVNPDNIAIVDLAPFTTDYRTIDDKTTAFVCRNFSCQAPVTDSGHLDLLLSEQQLTNK